MAWFGPIGVGAILYALEAIKGMARQGMAEEAWNDVVPVVWWLVFGSVVIHGCTVPVFQLGSELRARSRLWVGDLMGGPGLGGPIDDRFADAAEFGLPEPTPIDEEETSLLGRHL